MSAVELVRGAWEVLAAEGLTGVVDRYDEFFSEDLRWHPPASDIVGEFIGRDAYSGWAAGTRDTWDVLELSEPEFRELADSHVLVSTRMRARGAGSGVDLDQPLFIVYRVRNGRISWGRGWFDRGAAEAAVVALERGEEVPA